MNKIVVYCGANKGTNPIYKEQAELLGKTFAARNIQLIFGGGRVGIMGIIADAVLAHGGQVIGVIPSFLQTKEVAHDGLTQMFVVATMHERKKVMEEMADGVIVLPGGYGTLDEFFEMLTWAQLGLHNKPLGILNVNGYYNPLMLQLDKMVEENFLKQANRDMILISNELNDLLEKMHSYQPIKVKKWL